MNQLQKSNSNVLSLHQDQIIDKDIATAKAFPRNISICIEEAKEIVTASQETAESCFYCLPRAGKEIKGPSIRLAEIILYAWTNLKSATRIIGNDGKNITAEAICIDLEKNNTVSAEVRRSILTKTGQTYNADMQNTTANAACSIALRNAIFRVIPKHLINELYELALKHSVGDLKSLADIRQKGLSWFQKRGITQDKIFSYFGVTSIDQINQEHVQTMLGFKNSINENILTLENAFSKSVSDDTGKASELNSDMQDWVKDYDKGTGEIKS